MERAARYLAGLAALSTALWPISLSAEEPMNANGCTYVAATLDAGTARIRALTNQAEKLKVDGLIGRLSPEDTKALDAARKAREDLLEASRRMQAAYEDLSYRMRVCSRK